MWNLKKMNMYHTIHDAFGQHLLWLLCLLVGERYRGNFKNCSYQVDPCLVIILEKTKTPI